MDRGWPFLFCCFADRHPRSSPDNTQSGCLCALQVWNTRGVEGVHRFLARAYRVFEPGMTDEAPTKDQMRLLHATIKKVWGSWCGGGWDLRPHPKRKGPHEWPRSELQPTKLNAGIIPTSAHLSHISILSHRSRQRLRRCASIPASAP